MNETDYKHDDDTCIPAHIGSHCECWFQGKDCCICNDGTLCWELTDVGGEG